MGRAERSVDRDEQLPDLGGIALSERADGYLFAHNLIPADELPCIPGVRPRRPIGAECSWVLSWGGANSGLSRLLVVTSISREENMKRSFKRRGVGLRDGN
jgi:hypothetical protein